MHLLVAYPPTLAISTLAQRRKGRTAYAVRQQFISRCVAPAYADTPGRRPTSPSPAEAHHCRSSSNTPTAKQRRATPGDKRDGLTPGPEACAQVVPVSQYVRQLVEPPEHIDHVGHARQVGKTWVYEGSIDFGDHRVDRIHGWSPVVAICE